MPRVDFSPAAVAAADRAEWDGLVADAAAARAAVLDDWQAGRPLKFNCRVYGAIRQFVKDRFFRGRCAYCEILIVGFDAHAEHYRPKARVTGVRDAAGGFEVVTLDDRTAHPGYFWLAYDWANLVPSCSHCNTGLGKMNQFPVAKAHHFRVDPKDAVAALGPTAATAEAVFVDATGAWILPSFALLDALEEPRLLHPYRHASEDHLQYDDFGGVTPKDELGKASIDVYGLDRAELQQARWAAFSALVDDFNLTESYLLKRALASAVAQDAAQRARVRQDVRAQVDADVFGRQRQFPTALRQAFALWRP